MVYAFSWIFQKKWLVLTGAAVLIVWIFWGSIVKIVALRHPLKKTEERTSKSDHKNKAYKRSVTTAPDGTRTEVLEVVDKGVVETGTEKKSVETAQVVPSGGLGGLWLSGGWSLVEIGLGAYSGRVDAILGPLKVGAEGSGDLKWRVDAGYRLLIW